MAEKESDRKTDTEKGEEKSPAEDSGKTAKKKSGKILMISILSGIFLVQAVIAFLFVLWLKDKDPAVDASKKLETEERSRKEKLTRIGAILEKPIEVTVNIQGEDGEHYLKAVIQLEWDEKKYSKLGEGLAQRSVKIQDIIINVLSMQKVNDLYTSRGKQMVREAVKSEINMILPPQEGQIESVLFQEFLIQ